ncbi:MAG: ribosome biogenesis GTP-binding protein YihA/YsxC [bacterium]
MLSAHLPEQLLPDEGAEVAFAGRSNVGKSSAINAITNQTNLAKTSKTPGRTQQINFFELNQENRLVDLPGYGYAKAPAHLREHWGAFVTSYVMSRECLCGLIVPMDIRRPLTDLDVSMLSLCWESNLPVHILLTKSDKLGRGKSSGILHQVRRQLSNQPQTTAQLFSALKKQGVEEARKKITELLGGGQ